MEPETLAALRREAQGIVERADPEEVYWLLVENHAGREGLRIEFELREYRTVQ